MFCCGGGGTTDEAPPSKPKNASKSPQDLKQPKKAENGGGGGGGAPPMEAGSRVDTGTGGHRRTNSFKKVPSKKTDPDRSSVGPHNSDPSGPGGTPVEYNRSRSLKKPFTEEKESFSNSSVSPGNTVPDSGGVVNRGMKLTQNLKAPKPKEQQVQPAFSLSKKKPKDAAAEAKLAEETSKLDELLKSSDLRAFQYNDLKAAARNWSMDLLIGAGGFGKVYKGFVRLGPPQKDAGSSGVSSSTDTVEVAIKRLDGKSLQGHKEWMVEICMLGLVNHPHLVKLLGFCAEGEKRLLVYEFLPYFSLDRYLFGLDPSQPILDWDTRLRIALGSAKGLAHLHEEISPPIIYRDFKTSNILLDENFDPKLSDFGLAREGPSMDRTHVSTQVRGTAGYAAPEYMLTGHLTPKADVWSFGVVLLEMLTGRPSIDQRKPQHEMKLVPLARQRLQQPGDILELMDPNLEGQFPPQAAAKVAEVAKWCLQSDPNNRPLMSELVEVLAYLSRPEQWEE